MSGFWMDKSPLFIHRLPKGTKFKGPFFAIVDEGDEITVISPKAEEGAIGPYARITLGPFDLNTIGIMARASAALAEEKVPVFVLSSYRHDHILVPLEMVPNAVRAMSVAGFARKE